MKKILLILLILPMQVFAQRVNLINIGALIDTAAAKANHDSSMVRLATTRTDGFSGVRVFRSATAQDTIKLRWISMEFMNADMTVEFTYLNSQSGAGVNRDSLNLYFLAFRGAGTPDSSGYTIHLLETFSKVVDTTKVFHLSDSTFVSKRLFSKYAFEIRELKVQSNDYMLSINQFSPSGKRPIILRQ